ncbi:MAG: hypothetical protein BECKG1743D_GA0114223_110542 [Candidatus Kentron sp. G]|nr:MAG: hypothetical protein BECKG1743D_GA0114223_110542 [Candidatus Kentron sp. G]
MPFDKGPLQHRFQLRQANQPGQPERFDPGWGGEVKGDAATDRQYLRAIEQVGDTRIRTANGQVHPTLEIWGKSLLGKDKIRHRITLGPTDGDDHRSLTLTPDGRTVISGGSWGFIASYDVASGKELHRFIGHTGDVWAVAPVTSFEIRGTLSHDQAWVPDGAHGRS